VGVREKTAVLPCSTTAVLGLTEPPSAVPMDTVYFLSLNEAVTEQAPVIGPVVYTVPESVPPQPETLSIS
jgi:hypothetical protein